MKDLYLSLGSNLGTTYDNLNKACELLFNTLGYFVKISPVYKSPALGFEGPDFHNCVVHVRTTLTPHKVLKKIHKIEQALGRERSEPREEYKSRSIDIDILLYSDAQVEKKDLTIPHPEMVARKFVLQPLVDIAPELVHPVLNKTSAELLEQCTDTSMLVKQPKWLKNPKDSLSLGAYKYIAIEGNIGAGKTSLTQLIAQEFNAKPILERFKDNAFLPKFYKEPDRYAFPLEMSFLADRYQQLLDDIGQYNLFKDFMIADYDRYKSLIFAKVTLQEEEYGLYKRLHEMMYRDMPKPDLYVYLYQNTKRLLENIKKRGRDYETGMKPEYLEKINQGYLDFIKTQPTGNTKIIDISDLDFVNKREDYLAVINQF